MGLKGKTAIFETLFEWAATAVWPRVMDAAVKGLLSGNEPQDWGPPTQIDMAYEDGSAILRSLNFKPNANASLLVYGQAVTNNNNNEDSDEEGETHEGTGAGPMDEDEEAPDTDATGFAISRPKHVVDYLIKRYMALFERCKSLRDIRFVIDYVGYTPKIKEIIREYRSSNAMIWPTSGDRFDIFNGNAPFLNSTEDIFADREARRLYFKYITEQLLERIVKEPGFPKGGSFMIYGAVYKDTPDQCIAMARTCSTSGQILPVIVLPGNDNGAPMGEADIVIRWLLNLHRSAHNQLLISPDSDFLPILLHVINDKFREDPQPHKYNIYWQIRLTYKATVKKADYMQQLLPAGVPVNPYDKVQYHKLCSSWAALCAKNIPPKKRVSKKAAEAGPPDSFKITIRRRHHVLDMNGVFGQVWSRMFRIGPSCGVCDPIDIFNVLCHMAGGDYLKPFSFITFTVLWQAYSTTPDLHARLGECLCCRRDNIDGRLSFSTKAMERFIVIAYRTLHKVSTAELPGDNLKALSTLLKERVAKKQLTLKGRAVGFDDAIVAANQTTSEEALGIVSMGRKREASSLEGYAKVRTPPSRIPPDDLMDFIARVYWIINYYTRYHHSAHPVWTMDPLTEVSPGVSLYGYSYNNNIKRCEFASQTLRRPYLF